MKKQGKTRNLHPISDEAVQKTHKLQAFNQGVVFFIPFAVSRISGGPLPETNVASLPRKN